MLFTTLTFLFFFIAVYIVYWSVNGRARLWVILIASLVFYASWSIPFALHFFGIVAANYWIVARMQANGPSRRLLWLAIGLNAFNLFLFKYFYLFLRTIYYISDFVAESLFNTAGPAVLLRENFNPALFEITGAQEIILPLAISFYTFQITAYVVDVYRGNIPGKTGPLEFFVFILFFPQLVAGPIMRHGDFMHQLENIQPDENKMMRGGYLLCLGLIKKVVVADNTIGATNLVYANPDQFDGLTNIAAVFGYCVRVYCDFSGYTDVARGVGLLLGLKLPENFHAPYFSNSMRDLWQRWHVTLATWLRDYIYIPLGGSRASRLRVSLNLIITFTLGGLWHGANYTFIVWGFYHGVLLVIEREAVAIWERLRGPAPDKPTQPNSTIAGRIGRGALWTFQVTVVFIAFMIGAVPFNSPDIVKTWEMLAQMFTLGAGKASAETINLFALLPVLLVFHIIQYRRSWPLPQSKGVRYLLLAILGFVTMILLGRFAPGGSEYIYFQF